MTQTEKTFRALAALANLNVRTIWMGDSYTIDMGEDSGGVGSYGLNAVVRYTSWTDAFTAPGFAREISREDVAAHLVIWRDNRDPSVNHPHHREYLLREAAADSR